MPHWTPPNLQGLVQLSRKEGVDIRPALVRVLTDLYVQEKTHTREEQQQYVELALGLLPAVDPATRLAVANKLAAYPLAPPAVLEHLAPELGKDAGPVLDGAPAPRDHPDEPAGWAEQAVRIAGLPAASGTAPGYAEAAAEKDRRGGDLKALSLGELFMQADSAGRRHMLEGLEETGPTSLDGSPIAADEGTLKRLEAAALQRNQREFARELQHSLRLSRQITLRIVRDPSGEPILVVARALEMSSEILLRILLFLNPVIGESVERVFTLSRSYDRLSGEAARQVIASWREDAVRRATTRYSGVHADETSKGAAALMDNARRAVVSRSGESARQSQTARSPGWRHRTT